MNIKEFIGYFFIIPWVLVIMFIMQGCSPTVVTTYCEIYKPVYSSTKDTEATKVQIDNNNAIYEGLCK